MRIFGLFHLPSLFPESARFEDLFEAGTSWTGIMPLGAPALHVGHQLLLSRTA